MNELNDFWVFLIICGGILWLVTLIFLLKRQDMKDVDKIVWTIVLCMLNVLGAVLYWFLAPAEPGTPSFRARSEKELKDYFNTSDRKV